MYILMSNCERGFFICKNVWKRCVLWKVNIYTNSLTLGIEKSIMPWILHCLLVLHHLYPKTLKVMSVYGTIKNIFFVERSKVYIIETMTFTRGKYKWSRLNLHKIWRWLFLQPKLRGTFQLVYKQTSSHRRKIWFIRLQAHEVTEIERNRMLWSRQHKTAH